MNVLLVPSNKRVGSLGFEAKGAVGGPKPQMFHDRFWFAEGHHEIAWTRIRVGFRRSEHLRW